MYCYRKLPLISIIPGGVMKAQLRVQLDGLSGCIGQVFPDLGLNSAWLGGTGEAWERGPYYLSGLIPLAFLTGDPRATEHMNLWVEAILAGQQADGNFGPPQSRDWWPRMIVLKAFVGYYQATSDVRILDFMDRYFRYQHEQIDRQPLHFWASARAFEAMEAIDLLYSYRPQVYLTELVGQLRAYSYDFFDVFEHFPYTEPMTAYTSRVLFKLGKEAAEIWDNHSKKSRKVKPPARRESILRFNSGRTATLFMKTHGVNLAMALKYPATYGAFTGQLSLAELSRKGYDELYRWHGNSTGLFSSDEHLMGTSPAQGIELCTVVEMMYSLEEIGRVLPEPWVFELLESIAYNALPAMFTSDMDAHQYVQQPNQVTCDKAHRQFFDTDSYANTYGIAPNYGCCAANMHAGFPLFAGYMALRHPRGLAFPVYGACTVRSVWDDEPLEIREISDYPFDEIIRFEVIKAKGELELHFRPIANTDFGIIRNGEAVKAEVTSGKMISVPARQGDVIEIHCAPRSKTVTNPDGSKSIRYGNLLLALELEEQEIYLKGTRPFHDRGFVTTDSYNKTPFAHGDNIIIEHVEKFPPGERPFAGAPVRLTVKGRYFKCGVIRKHSACLPLPHAQVYGEEISMTLVPYGTTRLRISHFPTGSG